MRRFYPCEHYTLLELASGTVCLTCDVLRPRPAWVVSLAGQAASSYAPRWQAIQEALARGVALDEVLDAPEVVATKNR